MIEIVVDTSEFGWALCKVGPIFRKYSRKNPVHVMTAWDRTSIYKDYAQSIIEMPEWIEDFTPDCFRRQGLTGTHLKKLQDICYEKFKTREIKFHFPHHMYPKCQKNIPMNKMEFIKYKGNDWQVQLVESQFKNEKNIVIWPRNRTNGRYLRARNYPAQHWEQYVKLLVDDKRLDGYNIILLGIRRMSALSGMREYKNLHNFISYCEEDYVGFCMSMLQNAVLNVSSQSGGFILGLHCCVPSLGFGHEKHRHTIAENPHRIKTDFIEIPLFTYGEINPKRLYKHTIRMLGG